MLHYLTKHRRALILCPLNVHLQTNGSVHCSSGYVVFATKRPLSLAALRELEWSTLPSRNVKFNLLTPDCTKQKIIFAWIPLTTSPEKEEGRGKHMRGRGWGGILSGVCS